MKVIKVSHEELERLKKLARELSDEELDKVAGGISIPNLNTVNGDNEDLWCEPGCYPILNGCYCEQDW